MTESIFMPVIPPEEAYGEHAREEYVLPTPNSADQDDPANTTDDELVSKE